MYSVQRTCTLWPLNDIVKLYSIHIFEGGECAQAAMALQFIIQYILCCLVERTLNYIREYIVAAATITDVVMPHYRDMLS